jgi:pimeloyl-ACP methyl ester carboxylesterase
MGRFRSRKSTNVRLSTWALRRAAIRSIHPLAPRRAADLAARWFVTPTRLVPRSRAGDEGRALDDPAADPGTPIVVSDGRLRLVAHAWGRGPLALLVHGWNGRGLQLEAMARALAARGHRAVAFDHPAHGSSRGRTVTIPEMADAIQLVSEQMGGARALVAHSLGAVAATLALSRGLTPARAVYLAPPMHPEQWIARFGRALGLPASADPGLLAAVERRAGMPVAAVQPLTLAPRLRTELLIVHDRSDREVPVEDGEALARAWPGARLVVTDGLGHKRLLSSEFTVELVADFVDDAPVQRVSARSWGPRDPHFAAIVDRILAT